MLRPNTPISFIGIDPGATGGIAIICGSAVSAITMPRTEKSLWTYLSQLLSSPGNCVAALELVGGYINKGGPPCPVCHQQRNRQTGSAMFQFGEINGDLKMAVVAAGMELTKGDPGKGSVLLVPPQTWQSGLRIDQRRKSESDNEWKNRLRWNAEQFFPKTTYRNLKITLRTSDSLLIALYIKRLFTGIL